MAQSFEGLRGCRPGAARVQSFECCGLSACGPGRRVRICPPLATEGLKEYMARAENSRGQGQPHMLYFFPSHFPTSSHRADMVNRCKIARGILLRTFPPLLIAQHRADMVNRRVQSKWIVSTGAEAFWLKCARGVRARRRQADSLSLRGWQPGSHAIAGAPVDKQPFPCQKLVPPVEASDGCAIAHGRVGQRI